jgi:hypothetical protein
MASFRTASANSRSRHAGRPWGSQSWWPRAAAAEPVDDDDWEEREVDDGEIWEPAELDEDEEPEPEYGDFWPERDDARED